jgi:hypothetical protein
MINQMKQNDVALSVEFSVINEREVEGEGLILEWKVKGKLGGFLGWDSENFDCQILLCVSV